MARYHGFIDPVSVLARISRFAQPSEVAAPLELVRAGVVFHARGLVNTKAIQQNLDWVWPYWVRRQFDPADVSFLPRAFSITHVNLTHRNWTAIGTPDHTALAIVDPAGLLTPLFDGWSLDAWVVGEGKEDLLPAYAAEVDQTLHMMNPATGVEVHTRCANRDHTAVTRAYVEETAGAPVCTWEVSASSRDPAWLVVSLRPYNPEGVSFVHHIQVLEGGGGWQVGKTPVRFDVPAQRCVLSCYHEGDVHHDLLSRPESREVRCDVGMASAAALFVLKPETVRTVTVSVSLEADEPQGGARLFLRGRGAHNGNNARNGRIGTRAVWEEALEGVARLSVPDARFQFLYDAAVRSLILHSAREVYPGPYTYKRFWFRDAAFILHSMLCIGLVKRAEQVLDSFPSRQRLTGYFHSQDGEWDSNGEALWIMQRWCELSGWPPKEAWRQVIERGAAWITRKRTRHEDGLVHGGLLPAGFSAEHLGNNDFYYWDDFWAVAGYRAAAAMLERLGAARQAKTCRAEAAALSGDIEESLRRSLPRRKRLALPASPYRRMDAGAVGSLVASYPLQVVSEQDPRALDTAAFLLAECLHDGAFFQEMIHSGLNAYLTLHLAQVLLRAGDRRWERLWDRVASLASPTGQWPEAIHPRTGGGCMGDGHHVWASAEWVMMVRNAFVREEPDRLVLCSGLRRAWLTRELSFGPAPTRWGAVSVSVKPERGKVLVHWEGAWHEGAPRVEVRLPDLEIVRVASAATTTVAVTMADKAEVLQETVS